MKKYFKLMRVHHYIKNILILLPLIYSGRMFFADNLIKSILGFLAFSFSTSIVYIINDIVDIESDRKHPIKRKRPIACGDVTIKSASILIFILLLLSVILNYMACKHNIDTLIFIIIYVGINILYSVELKNMPLVDVTIIVIGFLIRVLYGSTIINVAVSKWLYLTVLSISFYLGFGKRRNEIIKRGDKSRKVLEYYTHKFLDKNMYACLTLTIVFYALWCVDTGTIETYLHKDIIWTVPLVMLICMRYSLDIEGNSHGDPVDVLLNDRLLVVLVLVYTVITFFIIYVKPIR